jgi:serine/threonine protein kinase
MGYFILEDQQQYLVQEYVEGQNLEQELKNQGVFTQQKIYRLLLDLLPVLEFVHSKNVIHRDIKPENIIRRKQDNKLVLVDFGAAKSLTPNNRSVTGTIIGSFSYMAPEQGNGKAIRASDLYSLGVTCLYLLTNKDPSELFDEGEHKWCWRNYLVNNPVDSTLGEILDKLVELGTKKRYQDSKEVWKALQKKSTQSTKIQQTPKKKSTSVHIIKENFSTLYGLAYTSYERGNYKEADVFIGKLIIEYPNEPNVLLLSGHIKVGLEQYQEAKQKYVKVLSLTNRQDLVECAKKAIDQLSEFNSNGTKSHVSGWTTHSLLDAYSMGRRDFSRQDLQGLIFKEHHLISINFYESNLSNANFQKANLNRADFGKTTLLNSIFRSANLSDAYFGYANAQGVDFRKATLDGANFRYANLKGANFCGVDLSNTLISPEQLATTKKNWLTKTPKNIK